MEAKQTSQRVLIVDEQRVIRAYVRNLLDHHSFEVCGEASDGTEAVEKAAELKPDIVLLNITMPRMNGIDAAREMRKISPTTKIVFLTLHDNALMENRTRALGRLIPKSTAATELIPALMALADTGSAAR